MRRHTVGLALAAAGYAALGELSYRGDRPVRDVYGDCVRAPADYETISLVVSAAIFVLTAALLALPLPGRWKLRTALGSAGAALAGAGLQALWYRRRMYQGAECPLLEFTGFPTPTPWLLEVALYGSLAVVLAVGSLAVGYAARTLRARVAKRGGL